MDIAHQTNYKIYNMKITNELVFSIINDLHFSYMTKDKKLKKIVNTLERIEPNYILFAGDLLDSVEMIEDKKNKQRLLFWLSEIGMIAPFIISLGSHDYCMRNKELNTNIKWLYYYPNEFIEEVNNIKNIYMLNNYSYNDKQIKVFGYTQGMNYFNSNQEIKHSIINPNFELKNEMIRELNELQKDNDINNINQNKINLMLIHSPVYLKDNDIEEYFNKYDYLISGHMHNGCVPPILDELWNSSYGLIGPGNHLFANNTRNTLKNKNDKLIVNGPLTMFHETNKLFRKLNCIYPYYLTNLILTSDKEYDTNKIKTKKMYTK